MNIHGAELGNTQNIFRENRIGDHHKEVCIVLAQIRFKLRGLQIRRLQHWQVMI